MRPYYPVIILCLLLTASSAYAADNTVNLGDLNIIHRTGFVENATFRAPWPRTEFAPKMAVEIRNTEKVKILVVDPNPLLFTYVFDGVTQVDSENFKNVQQFAEALQKLGTALGTATATASAASSSASLRSLAPSAARSRVMAPGTVLDADEAVSIRSYGLEMEQRIRGLTAMELEVLDAARRLQGLKAGALSEIASRDIRLLNEYEDLRVERVDEIDAILVKYDFNRAFFRALGTDVEKLSDIVAAFGSLTEQSAGGEEAVHRVKEEVDGWDLPNLTKRVNLAFKKIDEAEFDLVQTIDPGLVEEVQKASPSLLAILLAKDQEDKVRRCLESASAFSKRVSEIDVPLTLGEVSYAPGKVSTAKLTIQPREENAGLALKSGRKTGTFEIDFSPRSPVQFGFGAALLYSFVEKPEFGTKTENGMTTIIRKDDGDEYVAQNVAAILTLTPRGWFDPEFGAGFFVGVTPVKDELAFYLGAGIRAFRLVNIGLGWTYQEVPKLADGLRVGGEIAKPEDLKVGTDFKGGWFLSLNVNFR